MSPLTLYFREIQTCFLTKSVHTFFPIRVAHIVSGAIWVIVWMGSGSIYSYKLAPVNLQNRQEQGRKLIYYKLVRQDIQTRGPRFHTVNNGIPTILCQMWTVILHLISVEINNKTTGHLLYVAIFIIINLKIGLMTMTVPFPVSLGCLGPLCA